MGCGLHSQRTLPKTAKGGNTPGIETPDKVQVQYNYKLPELKIAQRVCNALQTKRKYLNESLIASPPKEIAYIFNLERRNCKAAMVESVNITAQILLVSNDLEFNTKDSSNYFTDVISDTTEPLAHICTEIFNPQTPLEQKNISNADAFLNKIYFVVFGTDANQIDTIQINTKTTNTDGSFSPLTNMLISVYTNESQVVNPKDVGVEKERIQKIPCSGSGFTSQKETFARSVFF